jgi:hypothetical protein
MFPTLYDVFLSYSRADGDRVKPLRDELRRLGYRVFFDVQSIDPGERWKDRLDRSIRASRTLVLCWSQNARGSDYITFEYSRAEALHKPVFPWLLDATPLPPMLDIQGVPSSNPAEVASKLRPRLGWPMRLRWTRLAIVMLVVIAALSWFSWKEAHPQPWNFTGRVVDMQTLEGIPNASVTVLSGTQRQVLTDASGTYHLELPRPQSKFIHLRCTKSGYQGEERSFNTNKPPDDWLLVKLKSSP